jgi:hypothetical protein
MAVMAEQSHNETKSDRSAGGLHLLTFSQVVIERILRMCSLLFPQPLSDSIKN